MEFPVNWFTEQVVEVTKTFTFEAAHALDGYEGKCKNIHGHSYELELTVSGKVDQTPEISAQGMVIDFGDLKSLVKNHVLPLYDHCLLLKKDSRFKSLVSENQKTRLVDFQPTCENMLLEIVWIIQQHVPKNISVQKCLLRETATSFAVWRKYC
jgi:6-pyruvoyltetrahydropterin/6-carboxytetrahydropterin synthase